MELLFSQVDFFSASTHQLEKAKQAARAIPEAKLKAADDPTIISELVDRFRLNGPTVSWETATVSRAEAQVDLMHSPGSMAFYEGRSHMVPGEKVTVTVPYIGEAAMFRIQPSTYTLNPPRVRLRTESLAFEYSGVQVDIEQSKLTFENTKRQIIGYLTTLAGDCDQFNQQLPSALSQIIQEKRARMERGEAGLAGFGLPIA